MTAAEYIGPLLALVASSFWFLDFAFRLEKKVESKLYVFDAVDIARFILITLAIGFMLLSLNFGRMIVNNDATNMGAILDTSIVVYTSFGLLAILGFFIYAFFILPRLLKKTFEVNQRENDGEI